MRRYFGSVALLAAAGLLCAQQAAIHPTPPPQVGAVRLSIPITFDGRLDEEVWHTAPAATGILQSQPRQGEPAAERAGREDLPGQGQLVAGTVRRTAGPR